MSRPGSSGERQVARNALHPAGAQDFVADPFEGIEKTPGRSVFRAQATVKAFVVVSKTKREFIGLAAQDRQRGDIGRVGWALEPQEVFSLRPGAIEGRGGVTAATNGADGG
jgi:hypothetical protein